MRGGSPRCPRSLGKAAGLFQAPLSIAKAGQKPSNNTRSNSYTPVGQLTVFAAIFVSGLKGEWFFWWMILAMRFEVFVPSTSDESVELDAVEPDGDLAALDPSGESL